MCSLPFPISDIFFANVIPSLSRAIPITEMVIPRLTAFSVSCRVFFCGSWPTVGIASVIKIRCFVRFPSGNISSARSMVPAMFVCALALTFAIAFKNWEKSSVG